MTAPSRWFARATSVAAGAALLLGVLALLTGSGAAAAAAGVASVVVAVLAGSEAPRRRLRRTAAPPPRDADVRERPGPVARPMPAAPEPSPVEATPDDLGLLGEEFLRTTLRHRVAVARRALRPVSLLCFEVLELDEASGKRPVPVEAVASVLRATVREADTTGLVGDRCFACILEDTGEDGAVWTAERLRRGLADADPGRRFRAGIASYPNHGLDAGELEEKAWSALDAARHWARDRIEVATAGQ